MKRFWLRDNPSTFFQFLTSAHHIIVHQFLLEIVSDNFKSNKMLLGYTS